MREETLGVRLRRLRTERGMSQTDVARPHYSGPYISTIEAGKRQPSPAALGHFAERLGVDVTELATGRPKSLVAALELRLQEAYGFLYAAAYAEAGTRFADVAEDAARYEVRSLQARSSEGLGLIEERQGRPEQGLEHFGTALRLWESEPLPRAVEAIAGIARCTQMLGDVHYAIHLLESYRARLKREGLEDPLAVMRASSSLIWPYTEAGLYAKAAESAAAALRYEPEVDNAEQIANMHINVARELLRRGRTQDALASLARAEDLYRVLNWKTELARAHASKAIVFAQQGDLTKARDESFRALQLLEGTASRLGEARALNELARVDRLLGNLDEATAWLERAITLLENGDVGELALAHRELGLCLVTRDPAAAESRLRRAIDLYRAANQFIHVAATHRDLGDLLIAQGNVENARETYRAGLLAVDEVQAA